MAPSPRPTHSAFRSLLAALGLTADELLADKDTLRRVLEVRGLGARGGRIRVCGTLSYPSSCPYTCTPYTNESDNELR